MQTTNRHLTLEICLIVVVVLLANQMTEEYKAITEDNTLFADINEKNICLTEVCNNTAEVVLSKMKLDKEPCEDFYEFACGKFVEETKIPDEAEVVSTFNIIEAEVKQQLKHILSKERPETDPKHLKLPNLLYTACMNKDKSGPEHVKEISESLGGWPVLVGDSWNSDNKWTWQETVKSFARLGLGVNPIVRFGVRSDPKNNTRHIIILDQSATFLAAQYFSKGINSTFVSAHYELLVGIAVLLGAEKETAEKELKESLQFEYDLVNISLSQEKRRNKNNLYNLRTIKQLQQSYPYVQWLDYVNGLLPEGLTVDENEVVNLMVPSFFDDLGKLLEKSANRTIANYMMSGVYLYLQDGLPQEFAKKRQQYNTVFFGYQQEKPRWTGCLDYVTSYLSPLLASVYIREHFQSDTEAAAWEMVNNIRNASSQILDKGDLMDCNTKQEAIKKLHAMTIDVGFYKELFENHTLEQHYRKFEIDPENFVRTILKLDLLRRENNFKKLRLRVEEDIKKEGTPYDVGAYYTPERNNMQIPAAVLQGHFFNSKRPQYMNYGAIGSVIGHEITHAFDDEGRQYDHAGNVVDWWQPDTEKEFLKRAQCIIDQYSNFTDKLTGLTINGVSTQGENIADNGGFKQSYLAYSQYLDKNGEEPTLFGLNFTSKQMFWISAAQVWCEKIRTERLRSIITSFNHVPSKYRIEGSFHNLKSFSKDFKCAEGSPMNPAHKCKVW